MSDLSTLISEASKGDPVALHALLDQHLPGLRAYLRLRMGPELRAKESASDLAQSVCLEILQHADRYQYQSDKNFRHWLYTTAMRKLSNKAAYYGRQCRNVRRESPESDLHNAYNTLSSPSGKMARAQEIERLERVFDTLSEDHREIICLSRIMGLSHREIAHVMDRSETATRSLLVRALSTLAQALEGEENAEDKA